jgi:ligand-binding sensor domain-containing protein/signal transduction histidine kinase
MFRSWNKQQGLPDDSVTAVLQTHDGYLWVGTSGGLVRFDGLKFTVMSPQDGKSNAPICITALCEDAKSRLWIGTQDNGLFCYENGVVSSHSNFDGLHFKTINSIAEDTNGTLWLGTPSGLEKLDGPSFTHFTAQNGLPSDFVSNVHVARSGTVWITTKEGMCQFKNGHLESVPFETDNPGRNPESLGVYEDRRGKLWAYGDTYLVNLTDGKHLNHFGNGDAASTRIWSLCEGQKGELWIGTSGKGLYCFVGDTFVAPTLYNGELSSDVRAICEDRQGNLWLGTHSDGLVRLQPRNIRVLNTASGLPNRSAVCLAFNPRGHAWIGFDRAGLYEGSAGTFAHVPSDTLPNLQNLVSALCVTSNSSLWAGTPGAGLYCIENQKCMRLTTMNGLSDNHILALAADSENAVWAGTAARLHRITNGVIAGFGPAEGLPNQPATSILPSRNGGVWLGFQNGAVYRENRGQFRRVAAPSVAASKPIRALCEDADGRIWIGTDGGHLGCITDSQVVGWDLPSGTPDTSILGIVASRDGDLWLGTDSSIYSIAQRDILAWLTGQGPLHQHLVYRADSIPSAVPTQGWPRALNAPDGTLWFAMDSGIVAIDLNSATPESVAPPVLIEDVRANGKLLPRELLKTSTASAKASAKLSSDVRSLDVHFTALDLSAPEKIRFRHRLEGSDQDWVVDNALTRDVHYPLLPYGKYTFRVQAGDADQTWFGNTASFAFIVPTPPWRAPWALTLYALALLALTGGAARLIFARRFRRRLAVIAGQQAMERERMRIARDMHDEIGSKLTKISFMTERAKRELQGQEPIAQKLDSIAGTSRDLLQTLDEIVWAVNPHNDTLEHLAAYLGQYATEYLQNTSVDCELHIPRGLPHYPLSAEARHNLFLAFEESLNNALKHGRATRVRVDMQLEPSRFDIIIRDNGCGFDANAVESPAKGNGPVSRTGGNGLPNMRQRLDLLGGECTVESQPGRGTTVILSLPLTSENLLTANGSKK